MVVYTLDPSQAQGAVAETAKLAEALGAIP